MQKWQYLNVYVSGKILQPASDSPSSLELTEKLAIRGKKWRECLDVLGNEGWELIEIIGDLDFRELIFKRPVESPATPAKRPPH